MKYNTFAYKFVRFFSLSFRGSFPAACSKQIHFKQSAIEFPSNQSGIKIPVSLPY